MPVGERFSARVQTGCEAHLASYTMGTGSFPGVKCGRGVALITHPPPIAEVKERVKLYLYSPPLGLRGMLWGHLFVLGELRNQLVYTKRTSTQSIYSRVRLHVSTRG